MLFCSNSAQKLHFAEILSNPCVTDRRTDQSDGRRHPLSFIMILERSKNMIDFPLRRSNADIDALSAKTDLSPRKIESWLRRRQRYANFASKPQVIDKFKESSWRLVFYLFIFLYGCITLWDKPWTWSARHLWTGWPKHPLDDSIRFFFIMPWVR